MDKTANAKSSSHKKFEGRLLCLCLTAACLSAPLNGLSPSLTLVASEFGYSTEERDIYLGENRSDEFLVVKNWFCYFSTDARFLLNSTICFCSISYSTYTVEGTLVYTE
jgi:hypothetical protein